MRTVHCLFLALLAAVGLATAAPARADGPLEGKWLIQVLEGGQQIPLWLVQLKQTDGKLTGEVLDGRPGFNQAKLSQAGVGKNNSLHLTIDFKKQPLELEAYPAKKGANAPDELVGALQIRNQRAMVLVSRSTADKLDPKALKADGKDGEDFRDATKQVKSVPQLISALKEFVKDHPKGRVTLQALRQLLQFSRALKDEEVADLAKQTVEQANDYGPVLKIAVFGEAIPALLKSEKGAATALEYAQEAEKLLSPKAAAADRQTVLKLLASALKKNKQAEEAGKVEAAVAKLNPQVDEEFEKANIPFDVKPFAKRKKGEDRTVVVELFTGAQCPPCVAADIGFDALAQTYKSRDVILLQYHLHIPGPDPMTNKDSETRSDQYSVEGTPTLFVDGKVVPGLGGPWQAADQVYQRVQEVLQDKLQEKAQAKVKLEVARTGDAVEVVATVSNLPAAATKVRLHFVVFQDVVHYTGSNGQRLHHHVVRGLLGGAKGVSLKGKGGDFKQSFSVKELRSNLSEYVNEHIKGGIYPGGAAPLDLHNLHVAAIVQDGVSAEILNAAQAAVPEKKE